MDDATAVARAHTATEVAIKAGHDPRAGHALSLRPMDDDDGIMTIECTVCNEPIGTVGA